LNSLQLLENLFIREEDSSAGTGIIGTGISSIRSGLSNMALGGTGGLLKDVVSGALSISSSNAEEIDNLTGVLKARSEQEERLNKRIKERDIEEEKAVKTIMDLNSLREKEFTRELSPEQKFERDKAALESAIDIINNPFRYLFFSAKKSPTANGTMNANCLAIPLFSSKNTRENTPEVAVPLMIGKSAVCQDAPRSGV